MQADLTFVETMSISSLFQEKEWPIDEKNKVGLYQRFVKTYSEIKGENERALFLKLARKYMVVPINDYSHCLFSLIKRVIAESENQTRQSFFIAPIKQEKDKFTIKSADLLCYLLKSTERYYDELLCKKQFNFVIINSETDNLHSKLKGRPLVLIDDFIGSGRYVTGFINELKKHDVPIQQIIVATLYITNNALKRLEENNIKVFYFDIAESLNKALTKKEQDLLNRIEAQFKIDEQYKLGYEQCACGISMIRTPNNTLPIFWYDTGKTKRAPFPR